MKRINMLVDTGKEKVELFFTKATIEFYRDVLLNKTFVIITENKCDIIREVTHIPFNKIIDLSIEEI